MMNEFLRRTGYVDEIPKDVKGNTGSTGRAGNPMGNEKGSVVSIGSQKGTLVVDTSI